MLPIFSAALNIGKKIGSKISSLKNSKLGSQFSQLTEGGGDGDGNFLSNLFKKKVNTVAQPTTQPNTGGGFMGKVTEFIKKPIAWVILGVLTLGVGFLVFKKKGGRRKGGW